jgi:negative regulator of flagellin synthesis FlgM
MKITGSDRTSGHINETVLRQTSKPADKAHKPADVPAKSKEDAIVNLSQRSKEVHKAQQLIQSLPDVRLEKVQAIKEKIENGTYEIDYDKTAEGMLKALVDGTI